MSSALTCVPLLLLTAGAAQAGPASTGRAGRAVRVPRTLPAAPTPSAVCTLDEDGGMCFTRVEVGAVGTALARDGANLGTTSIIRVEPVPTACNTVERYLIEIDRRRLPPSADISSLTLVVGMPLDPDARQISDVEVPGLPDNIIAVTAIDSDGDHRADLVVDRFGCDGDQLPGRRFGTTHICTEYWVAHGSQWRRLRVDQTANCQR